MTVRTAGTISAKSSQLLRISRRYTMVIPMAILPFALIGDALLMRAVNLTLRDTVIQVVAFGWMFNLSFASVLYVRFHGVALVLPMMSLGALFSYSVDSVPESSLWQTSLVLPTAVVLAGLLLSPFVLTSHLLRYDSLSPSGSSEWNGSSRPAGYALLQAAAVSLVPGYLCCFLLQLAALSETTNDVLLRGFVAVMLSIVAGVLAAMGMRLPEMSADDRVAGRRNLSILLLAFVALLVIYPAVPALLNRALASLCASVFLVSFLSACLMKIFSADTNWIRAFAFRAK